MTKFTQKSFSVAVGSDEYRDNYDRAFGKQPAPELELRGFEIDAAQYRRDGMPEAQIDVIRELRTRADRAWTRGDKSWADGLHREADRVRDEWYKLRDEWRSKGAAK